MLQRHLFSEQVVRTVAPQAPGAFILFDAKGDIFLVGRSDTNLADSLVEYLRRFDENELFAEAEPEEFVFRSFATSWEAYLQECEWRLLNPGQASRLIPVAE